MKYASIFLLLLLTSCKTPPTTQTSSTQTDLLDITSKDSTLSVLNLSFDQLDAWTVDYVLHDSTDEAAPQPRTVRHVQIKKGTISERSEEGKVTIATRTKNQSIESSTIPTPSTSSSHFHYLIAGIMIVLLLILIIKIRLPT